MVTSAAVNSARNESRMKNSGRAVSFCHYGSRERARLNANSVDAADDERD
jgi:hypothetical protein